MEATAKHSTGRGRPTMNPHAELRKHELLAMKMNDGLRSVREMKQEECPEYQIEVEQAILTMITQMLSESRKRLADYLGNKKEGDA